MSDVIRMPYDSPKALIETIKKIRDVSDVKMEAYTPYPIPELEDLLQHKTVLPKIIFVAGLCGALLGYGLQYFLTVIVYPISVGGFPQHSGPAFIPITFEMTILCSGLAAFFGLLVSTKLPQLWHPVFETEGFESASVDRFWLEVRVDSGAKMPEEVRSILEELKVNS